MYDPIQERTVVYETYRTDAENPYASGYVRETRWVSGDGADPLEQLGPDVIDREPGIPDGSQGPVNNPPHIDNDEHWANTVKRPDSDIKDILITGAVRLPFSLSSLLIRACVPDSIGLWNPILGFLPLATSISRTKSLWVIRRVNTDYHHGDCLAGSFWCGVQMKTGDHVHPVVGRIRAWDALIILLRLRVSSLLFISHLSFLPHFIYFSFPPIECVDSLARPLDPHFTTAD